MLLPAISHRHNFQHHGFTLIEVLIAMAIFAILSVMAYGGLEQIMENRSQTEESLQRLRQIQLTMTKMQRDFEQLAARDGRDELGGTLPALSTDQAADLLVQFTRTGWRNPAQVARSHLQRVAYKLDDDALVRISWPYVDRSQDAQAVETVLLDNVKDVSIRIMNEKQEWSTSWPNLSNTTPAGNSTLSRAIAIEITIKLHDWGDIVRLYRITG
ncbi:MAG: type II secretion system minor pseudopilin GspJ [Gammaproteobacteria bacterium]|nr:type II secretion system minor pseudopilin GspJ [Gammaproteobacteria bacterium]